MSFLRQLKNFMVMFQGLLGMFMSGLVALFTVGHSGSTVCVCGKLVVLSNPLLRVVRHNRTHHGPRLDASSNRFIQLFNCEQYRGNASLGSHEEAAHVQLGMLFGPEMR
jgi:hypothetical protein